MRLPLGGDSGPGNLLFNLYLLLNGIGCTCLWNGWLCFRARGAAPANLLRRLPLICKAQARATFLIPPGTCISNVYPRRAAHPRNWGAHAKYVQYTLSYRSGVLQPGPVCNRCSGTLRVVDAQTTVEPFGWLHALAVKLDLACGTSLSPRIPCQCLSFGALQGVKLQLASA